MPKEQFLEAVMKTGKYRAHLPISLLLSAFMYGVATPIFLIIILGTLTDFNLQNFNILYSILRKTDSLFMRFRGNNLRILDNWFEVKQGVAVLLIPHHEGIVMVLLFQ